MVACGDAAVADVVPDGIVEKHRVLGDHADVCAQRSLRHLRKHVAQIFSGTGKLIITLVYTHFLKVWAFAVLLLLYYMYIYAHT